MPFQPPPQQNPLEQLFQLYQLQESMNASKRQQAQEALSIAVRLAEAGGDPRQVQGVDPSRLPLLEQLSSRAQEKQRLGRLGTAAQFSQSFNLPQALAPRADESGNLVVDPVMQQRATQALEGLYRNLNLDPSASGSVSALTQANADAIARTDQAAVAEEKRRRRDSQAAIDAQQAAGEAQIELRHQRALERIQVEATNKQINDFIAGSGDILMSDPFALETVRNQAVAQFGPLADVVVERAQFQGRVNLAKSLGATAPLIADGASPRMAQLALNDRAYKDPWANTYVEGSKTGQPANDASTRAGLYRVLIDMDVASESFARSGDGMLGVATMQDLIRKTGGQESPAFAMWQTLQTNAQALIAKARSGAALNELEIKNIEKMFASPAQIRFTKDGKLDKATRVRLESLKRVLRNEHLGRMSWDNEETATKNMMDREVAWRRQSEDWAKSLSIEAPMSSVPPSMRDGGVSHMDAIMDAPE